MAYRFYFPYHSPSLSNFEVLYSTSFTISYLLTWFATVFFLKSYSTRLGKRKFWLLVTLPLLFLIGQVQTDFYFRCFYQFRLHEPIAFTITYTVIFTILKVTWSHFLWCWNLVSRKKNPTKVNKEFLEFVRIWLDSNLCFKSSNIINWLFVSSSGLTAVCFVGLSSFPLLAGTYSRAISVANDIELHKSIRRSVKEYEFLHKIGHAEMELEIKKKVYSTMNVLSSQLKQETGID